MSNHSAVASPLYILTELSSPWGEIWPAGKFSGLLRLTPKCSVSLTETQGPRAFGEVIPAVFQVCSSSYIPLGSPLPTPLLVLNKQNADERPA